MSIQKNSNILIQPYRLYITYVYKTNLNTNILDMRYNFLHNHKRLVLKEVHVK